MNDPIRPDSSTTLPDRKTLLAFAGFVIVTGGAAIAVRITLAELAPFWGAAVRFSLAASIFWGIALLRKVPTPRERALTGAVLYGALAVGAGFTFAYWALTVITASLFHILVATVPLLTLFFAFLHRLERFHRRGLLGSLTAITGIAVVVGGSSTAGVSIPHAAAALLAAACFAEAGVVAKQFPRTHPIATNAVGMTVGGLMLFAVSLLSGEEWTIPTQADTWIAFIFLVVVISVGAFVLYLYVLGRWTATGASYGFVLNPLVTIVLAALLLGERVTVNFVIGAALVLFGVFIGALLPTTTTQEPATEVSASSPSQD